MTIVESKELIVTKIIDLVKNNPKISQKDVVSLVLNSIESDNEEELDAFKKRKYQYMAKDKEGRDVFLADSNYVLQMAQQDFKHIKFHFTSEF